MLTVLFAGGGGDEGGGGGGVKNSSAQSDAITPNTNIFLPKTNERKPRVS